MRQLFFCSVKGIATGIISFFMLLFAVAKTHAQWIELGGANENPFPTDYTGGNYIRTIATDTAGNVYANSVIKQNSLYYYFVAKWNDTAWSALGGVSFSFINSIVTDKSGNVYVGGNFSASNDSGFIAKWNGTAWSVLGGTPFNGYIRTIAIDATGNVYAAGNLHDNSNSKGYVAKWDGTVWSELGGANGGVFNNLINSISTDASGNVYAAGDFTDASNHQYVAKWNNTAWSELGGVSGSIFGGSTEINSIATDASGNVYAGGYFVDYTANGFYVAKWNGTAWSELGGAPFSYYINSVATDTKGNVYAGGNFGVNTGNHFVNRWNGTTWSELGGAPFKYQINSIAVATSGNVYAGGNFTDSNHHYYVAEYAQNILPVTIVNFTVTKEKTGVAINWQTATETNSSHFNVQHSINGNSFANIGTIKAIGSGANSYRFIDNNPANGINYYRLQNVDKDGSFTYTPVIIINEAISFSASIYPNPVQNNLKLNFNSDKAKTVQVQIVSNEGKIIFTQQIQVSAGTSTLNIIAALLTNGEYYIKLVGKEEQTVLKFVKER